MSQSPDMRSRASSEGGVDLPDAGGSLKRKAADGDAADGTPHMSKRAAKRKTRGDRRSKKGDEFEDIDETLHINPAFARMDGALLSDYLARQTQRCNKDLSVVEVEDRRLPAAMIQDTSSWAGTRTLENLTSFVEDITGKKAERLKEPGSKENGSPHTLVIGASGIRAADITRALRVYQTKKVMVAKLFAKHIKLSEAVESAKTTKMNFGVGTPQRLVDLAQDGALSTDRVKWIIVDASHVNEKKRGVFDQDTLGPLMEFLTLVKHRCDGNVRGPGTKVAFF